LRPGARSDFEAGGIAVADVVLNAEITEIDVVAH
jgi:hypothetical protein